MSTQQITQLKSMGLTATQVYEVAAGNYGLFGKAFFGHKKNKTEAQKLSRVWERIMKVYV